MSDTSARLLSLLSLLQTNREWPGSVIAERLGVSRRTVRRDIDRLRTIGYPVEATMGGDGGYRLVAGAAMPPLLLDDGEAVAIAIGLRIAAGQAIEGIDEASVRALAKLEQVLPARLRRRVGVIGAATVPLSAPGAATVDPASLTTAAAAIARRERLRFRYRAADGTGTDRLVEPHKLLAENRRWYLLAFDTARADWRVFRVDRCTKLLATGARISTRDVPEDAAAFVRDRAYARAPTYRAVVTLQAPAAEVAGRWELPDSTVVAIDAGTCRLTSHLDTLEWLAFRLTTLGCEFTVHEPPELVTYLRHLGGLATRATAPTP